MSDELSPLGTAHGQVTLASLSTDLASIGRPRTARGEYPTLADSRLRGVFVLAVLFSLSTVSRPAAACTYEHQEHWGFLGPANGRLPANALGVLWHSARLVDSPSPSDILEQVSVSAEQDDAFREVPAAVIPVPDFKNVFLVGPADGLKVGATYRFVDSGPRRETAPESVLVTVDNAELHTSTRLTATAWPLYSEVIPVSDRGGPCTSGQFVAQVLVETSLPEPASEWVGQLLYRTFVDDGTWRPKTSVTQWIPPGRSWRETGQDLVYSVCDDPSSDFPPKPWLGHRRLEPTSHTVRMQAFLPGTDVVLESEEVVMDLSCPGHLEPQ